MKSASKLSSALIKAAINKNIDENVTAKLVEAAMSATLLEAAMSATMMGVAIDAKDKEETNKIEMKTSMISDDVEEDLPRADQKEDKISQGKFF